MFGVDACLHATYIIIKIVCCIWAMVGAHAHMQRPFLLMHIQLSDIQWNDSDEQLEFALAARLQKARSLRAQANQGKSN